MIKLENIKFSHSPTNLWQLGPLSLEIKEGECVALIGASGSGKTTIFKLIAGLCSPQAGCIRIDGETIVDQNINLPPEKRQVGLMFQDHVLFPHFTVRQNICFGISEWDKRAINTRLNELEAIFGLKKYYSRFPHELSGGQQQRVALARTLAPRPKVILLDEPLCSVDADLRSSLTKELYTILKATQTTAVWITHDQAEAFDIGEHIAVIKDGQIIQTAAPVDLYNKPASKFVAEFIGQSGFLRGQISGNTISTTLGNINIQQKIADGIDADLLLRPKDIMVEANPSGFGVITKKQFRDGQYLYTITLPSKEEIFTLQPLVNAWEIGQKVEITITTKQTIVFAQK